TAAEIRGRPEAADAGRVLPLAAGTRLVQRRRIHRADAAARHGVQCPRRLRRGLPRQEAGARMAMKILVTGSDGYIGARMVPRLLAAGHEVTGLDTGLYRDGWLYSEQHGQPVLARTLNMDLRRVEPRQLEGFDAVVHLAELSNDPLGQNDPQVTRQINLEGSVRLARAARRAGVGRFVYASSCSVYGQALSDWDDADSPPNPQTTYAECKVGVERELGTMADAGFCVTFMRNATAYGA